MKKTLVFGALYLAFAIGALATSLFGRAGIASLGALRSHVRDLQSNITELRELSAELAAELERLRTDPDTVKLLARELGYLQSGERRIVLESYAPPPETTQVGYVLQAPWLKDDGGKRWETLYLAPLLVLFVAMCIDSSRVGRNGSSR